ncbi:MAG: homoserine kinase [Polyangiaceae bacterium]
MADFLEKYEVFPLVELLPLAAGSVNSNFRIRAAEKDYFLRIYEEQDLAGARRDADTVAALALAGVATPSPIAKPDAPESGHAYVSDLAGKPAALFPWEDGEILCQARVTKAHVASVGASLAATHLAGSALASRYGVGRFRSQDLRERIARIANADDPRISSLAPRLLEKLEACAPARSQHLPRGLAHGDLFRDNVLFSKEKPTTVLALLDFESAFEGFLIFDVMVTMLAWCVGDALDFDLARALVDGYQSVRPLTPAEKKYAFQEARFGSLRFWITRVTDYAMRLGFGNGRDPGRFEMRLNQIEALGSQKFEAALFEK